MSEQNRVNYSSHHDPSDVVIFAQMIKGRMVKTEMPRQQAEMLREAMESQRNGGSFPMPLAPAEMHQDEAFDDIPEQTAADSEAHAYNKANRLALGKRVAKTALIGTLIVGSLPVADYVYTRMSWGEAPGLDMIMEDPFQLPGQLKEAGQNFGGFVEQVRGVVDTASKLGGSK